MAWRRAVLRLPHSQRQLATAAGPSLADFLPSSPPPGPALAVQGVCGTGEPQAQAKRLVFLETYGCQMNVSDSEVLMAVLTGAGFTRTADEKAAELLLLNTCAIREGAEAKVWARLRALQHLRKPRGSRKVIGVLGCMAERLKAQLLETDGLADVVAGPDAYRDLPRLVEAVLETGAGAMNVQLSAEETYGDITPVRDSGSVAAFVTISRGCNNMCAFCIVPYTRGRERSRDPESIEGEVRRLSEAGYKEVTLLGQNVNSYAYGAAQTNAADPFAPYAAGFSSVYKPRREGALTFADLLHRVAAVDPEMRVRFTSPHPKDFGDDVLDALAAHPNLCKQLHLPAQSGSTAVLSRMARGYSREAYITLAERCRDRLPGVALSSDFIAGFCGETEGEHAETLSLLERMRYEQAFLFAYSRRDKTAAARHLADDVPPDVKQRRLAELIDVFRAGATQRAAAEVGKVHCVMVEGPAKRNGDTHLTGRTDSNRRMVLLDSPVPAGPGAAETVRLVAGDYVAVKVTGGTMASLVGDVLFRTTLGQFACRMQQAVQDVSLA